MTGRPRIYENAEEMQKAIDNYFEYIKGQKGKPFVDDKGGIHTTWDRWPEPATITGLALFLGFSDRQSLYDYQERQEFSCIIKRARTLVECEYEKKLSLQSPAGAIFALKNMGWKDKQETEHSGELGIKQITGMVIK